MAAITTAQAGFYDVTTTWTGGVVPVQGDTITLNHAVTIRDTRLVGTDPGSVTTPATFAASTVVTIAAGGQLIASRVANSSLTIFGSLAITSATSVIDYGTNTDCISPYNVDSPIPSGISATIRFATAGNLVAGKYVLHDTVGLGARVFFRGAPATINTTLTTGYSAGAGTIVVADGTGWTVGSRIAIHTSDTFSSHIETFGIKAISGTAPATITLGLVATPATSASLAWAHIAATPVSLISSNVTVGGASNFSTAVSVQSNGTVAGRHSQFLNTCFEYMNNNGGIYTGVTTIGSGAGVGIHHNLSATQNPVSTQYAYIGKCSVFGGSGGFQISFYKTDMRIEDCAHYSTTSGATAFNGTNSVVTFNRCVGYNTTGAGSVGTVFFGLAGSKTYNDCWLVSLRDSSSDQMSTAYYNRCTFGCNPPLTQDKPIAVYNNCNFGTFGTNGITAPLVIAVTGVVSTIPMTDCNFVSGVVIQNQFQTINQVSPTSVLRIVNYNQDPTDQRKYIYSGDMLRNNSQLIRSRSSIQFSPRLANVQHLETFSISASVGIASTFRFGLRYDANYTNGTPPSVTISGMGITPQTFTAGSSINTDYQGTITVTPLSAGSLTVTVTTQSVNTTGNVYFSGMSFAPWIDWSQHYGYLYAPSSATLTVDPIVQLSESSAAALTGISYSAGTLTLAANRSIREIYDWLKQYEAANQLAPIVTSSDGVNFSLSANLTQAGGNITGTGFLTLSAGKTHTPGSSTSDVIVTSDAGTTGIFTLTGLAAHTVYLESGSAVELDYRAGISSFTYYVPAGATGLWRWRAVKYGNLPETGTINVAGGGRFFAALANFTDAAISQPTLATVLAYATLETWDKVYDYCQAYLTTSSGRTLGQFANKNGAGVDLGAYALTVDSAAAQVFALSTGITIKATTLGAGTLFSGGITAGAVTASGSAVIDTWYTSAAGRSVLIRASSILADSRAWLYNQTAATTIDNSLVGSSGVRFRLLWTADATVRLTVTNLSYQRLVTTGVLTNTGLTFLSSQTLDAVYIANGINGALCDGSNGGEFTADLPNVQVDINDNENSTELGRAYAWAKYFETTPSGIVNFLNCLTATDTASYAINGSVVDLAFDNKKAALLTIGGGFVTKTGGSSLVAPGTTGSIYFNSGKAYLAESASLPARVWNYTQ
jgi:hypothetical protein